MATGDEIRLEDLRDEVTGRGSRPVHSSLRSRGAASRSERDELAKIADEQARIERALELADGDRERAAELLAMSRTTLWGRMKKHGLVSAALPEGHSS